MIPESMQKPKNPSPLPLCPLPLCCLNDKSLTGHDMSLRIKSLPEQRPSQKPLSIIQR
jgi:hypothetical protein